MREQGGTYKRERRGLRYEGWRERINDREKSKIIREEKGGRQYERKNVNTIWEKDGKETKRDRWSR